MARISMKVSLVAVLLLFSVLGVSQAAAAEPNIQYPGPLVSTSWVAQHLQTIENPNQTQIRLVEVSPGGTYASGHIPGAVHVTMGELFAPQTDHMVLDYTQMKLVLKTLGVTHNTKIILYDEGPLFYAARFYWTLSYWNIGNVSIMNGGTGVWKSEGRPLTKVVPAVKQLSYTLKYPPDTKIDALLHPDVMYALATGNAIFLDSRPEAYYNGSKFLPQMWERGGHIPGAVYVAAPEGIVTTHSLANGKLLSDAQLKTIYESKGVTPNKSIITYCNTGVRAALNWFVLSQVLKYPNVKNYDGSMRQYSNDFYLPMQPSSFDYYKNLQNPLSAMNAGQGKMNAKISQLSSKVSEISKVKAKITGFASTQSMVGSYIIAIIAIIIAVASIVGRKK